MAIKIALVEPAFGGNIGATARVMKNFGFKELILINPKTELTNDTYRFAMHAEDVLANIKIYKTLRELAQEVPYLVGTTARICTDRGSMYGRAAISSNNPTLVNILQFKSDCAIVFGREDSGLTNEEIDICDMTVHIPTSKEYKALNLAQSVAIILYSLHILKKNIFKPRYREATVEEKELLIEWFNKLVSIVGIYDWKELHLMRRFRNIIGRAFVSGKEATSLVGVFSKAHNRIKELEEKLGK